MNVEIHWKIRNFEQEDACEIGSQILKLRHSLYYSSVFSPTDDFGVTGASLTKEKLSVLPAKGDRRRFSWSSSNPTVDSLGEAVERESIISSSANSHQDKQCWEFTCVTKMENLVSLNV